jgi:hypothetical protein
MIMRKIVISAIVFKCERRSCVGLWVMRYHTEVEIPFTAFYYVLSPITNQRQALNLNGYLFQIFIVSARGWESAHQKHHQRKHLCRPHNCENFLRLCCRRREEIQSHSQQNCVSTNWLKKLLFARKTLSEWQLWALPLIASFWHFIHPRGGILSALRLKSWIFCIHLEPLLCECDASFRMQCTGTSGNMRFSLWLLYSAPLADRFLRQTLKWD